MSNQQYDIYFKGESGEGFTLSETKLHFATLFKIDRERIGHFFSGKAVYLKRSIDKATAIKYQSALNKAGCKIYIQLTKKSTESAPPLNSNSLAILPAGANIVNARDLSPSVSPAIDISNLAMISDYSQLEPEVRGTQVVVDYSHLTAENNYTALETKEPVIIQPLNTDHLDFSDSDY